MEEMVQSDQKEIQSVEEMVLFDQRQWQWFNQSREEATTCARLPQLALL